MGTVVSFSLLITTTEDQSHPDETRQDGRGRDEVTTGETPARNGTPAPSLMQAPTSDEAEGLARAALGRAVAVLHAADEIFSTYKPQSPVSRLRRADISLGEAPPEVAQVLSLCESARAASCGWFDPWRLPGGLDPTGYVKGWAAQRALGELRAAGVAAALINAGGDIAAFGQPLPETTWHVGIRDPRATDRLLGAVRIDGAGAVATSGAYERGGHIIDPTTGRPAQGLLSATVTGPDLALADALATGLFASAGKGLSCVARRRGYGALVVGADGSLWATPGFPFSLSRPDTVPVPA
jgi:thiamine biosynthesis lipoprotein